MATELTGVVDWKLKSVHVNGNKMKLDEIGGFTINVSEILAVQQRVPGIEIYLNELEQMLSFEQIKLWYHVLGTSVAYTIRDVAALLDIDKHEARMILDMGITCGVLCKGYNSVWKVVDKITKDRIRKDFKEMEHAHTPKRGVDEVFKEERERMRKLEEPEEAIVENDDEPAKIVVGMKGVAVQPKRKVIQASQFAKAPVSEGVILPKKKPLETVSQGAKKSRKSAKG